jgi:hypothetical protein
MTRALAVLRRMDGLTRVAAAGLLVIVVLVVVGRWLPFGSATRAGFGAPLAGPGGGWNALGTDQLGRAMVPRLLAGTEVTVAVAAPTAIAAAAIAALIAAFVAYRGGWLDGAGGAGLSAGPPLSVRDRAVRHRAPCAPLGRRAANRVPPGRGTGRQPRTRPADHAHAGQCRVR